MADYGVPTAAAPKRVDELIGSELMAKLDQMQISYVGGEDRADARVVIVTAGTSDSGPAREALRTLAFNGISATIIFDVGVAGIWRLMDRLDEIRRHDVIIAVAGMDAALVSVLGGLVAQPLIAVPTSTGYGAARNGETALAASLASCAAGVTVCNIDNGYGAACAVLRILGRHPVTKRAGTGAKE